MLIDHTTKVRTPPLQISDFRLDGFAATAAMGGQTIDLWTRLAITSDDPLFHTMADNLIGAVTHCLEKTGPARRPRVAESLVIRIHEDDTADVWVDSADMLIRAILKSDKVAGQAVYEDEIADVTEMKFSDVDVGQREKFLCIFRVDWRFGLFFDLNPEKSFSIEHMTRDLGTLYRNLKYRQTYDALDDETSFKRLVSAGWFPFAEIIGQEFKELANCARAGFPLGDVEQKLVNAFDESRIERLRQRWLRKPHFATRTAIVEAALRAYTADDPVSAIKIVVTELEGILAEAYFQVHGRKARIKNLLEFAASSARKKTQGAETLLLTEPFAEYLAETMFSNFDPEGPLGDAKSRHAVSHGAADPESYTKVRALQALLTLDQLAFYT